jgi:hypothetical protein
MGKAHDMSKTKTITYDPNWQETYKSQILTAAEAVKKIRPGQRVFIGTGTASRSNWSAPSANAPPNCRTPRLSTCSPSATRPTRTGSWRNTSA